MNSPANILTLNAGSSSLKFSIYRTETPLRLIASGQAERLGGCSVFSVKREGDPQKERYEIGETDHAGAVHVILDWLGGEKTFGAVIAVSHRVVHGGPECMAPLVVDDDVFDRLERLVPLAPLHQPFNLACISASRVAFPAATQIACFDTSFHRSHPFVADTFALPRKYYEEGLRRYGFHGLSYEYIARRLQSQHPTLFDGRAIVAHLGNGASMCAMRAGRSVASTMGFTALDGLPMGSRCGQLDPGVVLYLLQQRGMDVDAVSKLLYEGAGLKGMSGISHDVRDLLASHESAAHDALAYFADRVRREIGALATSLGGLDTLIFTGGIGENAAEVRAMILKDLEWMGIDIDPQANQRNATFISSSSSRVHVLVMHTDEERMLAEHAVSVVTG